LIELPRLPAHRKKHYSVLIGRIERFMFIRPTMSVTFPARKE
jgi:hypothetical protein